MEENLQFNIIYIMRNCGARKPAAINCLLSMIRHDLMHRTITNQRTPNVKAFFDTQTSTLTYVAHADNCNQCVIIDPVLDIDEASATITTQNADSIVDYITSRGLVCCYILETHAHADHLSAAFYLRNVLGGDIVIGADITKVQPVFATLYSEESDFPADGAQFDILVTDGQTLPFGASTLLALHVPGHTPACMAYVIGDAVFCGDTLFMPDSGTARCDFPGGDASALYRSIKRLLTLPDETRVFVCHDYQPDDREIRFETTILDQRERNIHVNQNVTLESFVQMRNSRDAELATPRLMLPAMQVNIRAGALPLHPTSKRPFLTLPINALNNDPTTLLTQKS